MRVFLVFIGNLAIPFLLFYLRNLIYKIYYVKVLKQPEKEVPKLNWAITFKLVVIGLVLMSVFLGIHRLKLTPETREQQYKVKEYNFR